MEEPRPEAADEELVERARRGHAPAYDELVRRYTRIAFRAAYVVTGSTADAEDAAQDAFVKAHRALPRFRSGAPFRPWLLRIVGNEARNRRRSAGRRAAVELRAAAVAEAGGGSPHDAAEAAEDRRALLQALEALPEDQRQVVTCRYLLQLSVDEAAAALGVPAGTVKSRLSRALDRLRELLEPRSHG